jgi:hypothetical protein
LWQWLSILGVQMHAHLYAHIYAHTHTDKDTALQVEGGG